VRQATRPALSVSQHISAGEVLDLDGPIGGYNFQAAFSTGWLARTAAAESLAISDPLAT
jgi:predicted flavoprotein YhiN